LKRGIDCIFVSSIANNDNFKLKFKNTTSCFSWNLGF